MIQASTIPKVHELFLKLYQVEYNSQTLKKSVGPGLTDRQPDLESYLDLLNQAGSAVHMAYFRNHISPHEIREVLRESTFPVLVFLKTEANSAEPAIFHRSKGQYKLYRIGPQEAIKETVPNPDELVPQLATQAVAATGAQQQYVLMVTCFPNAALYSTSFDEPASQGKAAKDSPHKPLQRLGRL